MDQVPYEMTDAYTQLQNPDDIISQSGADALSELFATTLMSISMQSLNTLRARTPSFLVFLVWFRLLLADSQSVSTALVDFLNYRLNACPYTPCPTPGLSNEDVPLDPFASSTPFRFPPYCCQFSSLSRLLYARWSFPPPLARGCYRSNLRFDLVGPLLAFRYSIYSAVQSFACFPSPLRFFFQPLSTLQASFA